MKNKYDLKWPESASSGSSLDHQLVAHGQFRSTEMLKKVILFSFTGVSGQKGVCPEKQI